MFGRKRRGTFAQELGKTIGGVATFAGMLAFCKARGLAQAPSLRTGEVGIYRSAYFGGSGDLFAPFPADHVHAVMWIGALVAVGGILLRLKSYWRITAPREEDQ
jgi:hypothetical protein